MMGTFKKEAEDHLGALPRVSLERALRWSDLPKACLPLTWGLVQLSGSGLMTGCLGCLTCPTPIRRGAAVRSSAAPQRGCLANLISSCVAQERGVHKISFNKAPCQCAGVQNSLQFDRILTCRNRSLSSSEHSSNHSGAGAPGCPTRHHFSLPGGLLSNGTMSTSYHKAIELASWISSLPATTHSRLRCGYLPDAGSE
jgi:hypothetical protein